MTINWAAIASTANTVSKTVGTVATVAETGTAMLPDKSGSAAATRSMATPKKGQFVDKAPSSAAMDAAGKVNAAFNKVFADNPQLVANTNVETLKKVLQNCNGDCTKAITALRENKDLNLTPAQRDASITAITKFKTEFNKSNLKDAGNALVNGVTDMSKAEGTRQTIAQGLSVAATVAAFCGPVGVAVGAVLGAAAAVVSYWPKIKGFFSKLFG